MCIICRNTWNVDTTRQLFISCGDIESVPVFTNTEILMLENCESLLYIPRINTLNTLYIVDCKLLYRVQSLSNLTKLYISNTSIATLPNMPNLEILDIENCSRFTRIIGDLPNLISLSLRNCPKAVLPSPDAIPVLFDMSLQQCNIETIPDYPMVSHLWLHSMHCMSQIPVLENLEYISIIDCYLIGKVPSIPSLRRMIIIGTGGFLNLPAELHSLESLELSKLWFRNIPYYPRMTRLCCIDCPILENIHHTNLNTLTIVDCPKMQTMPCHIGGLKYFRCNDNSPLRIYSRFLLPSVDYTQEDHNRFVASNVRLSFLQNKFREYNYRRRARKFLSLCFSEPFCRLFWNPDGIGGRWHIKKMQGFAKTLKRQLQESLS